MLRFTAEAALTVSRPYAMVQTKTAGSREAFVYPQQARASIMGRQAAAADGGGASCYCPCCIISGGILWCC